MKKPKPKQKPKEVLGPPEWDGIYVVEDPPYGRVLMSYYNAQWHELRWKVAKRPTGFIRSGPVSDLVEMAEGDMINRSSRDDED